MGPDLAAAVNVMKNGLFEKIEAKAKPNDDYFSPRELKIINNLCEIYRETKAEEISEISHLPNQPWAKTKETLGMSATIDYLLAIDGTKDSLPLAVARERHQDRLEMIANYGLT